MNIQKEINKAQGFKEKVEQLNNEMLLPLGVRRKIETIEKDIIKYCEKYDLIYWELARDAKRNNWRISDYHVNDYFDYETFDYDVSYL